MADLSTLNIPTQASVNAQIKEMAQQMKNYIDNGQHDNDWQETITVQLHASAVSDWSTYTAQVVDQSTEEVQTIIFSADGLAQFEIPAGHVYEVVLPTVIGYTQPMVHRYVATGASRTIAYEYSAESRFEILDIIVRSKLTGAELDILDGTWIGVTNLNTGETYEGVFSGATCRITIPYGAQYAVSAPFIEGYSCDFTDAAYNATLSIRSVVWNYEQLDYGFFGVDEEGRRYTIEEMEALDDKTIIKYGFYSDADLAASTRVDSGSNNSFYWKVGSENIGSMQWATQNVQFDTTRLPFYDNLGAWRYAGMYMTKMIKEIGEEIISSNNPTPAASACLNRTITIGGVEHQGFLLSYNQILKIATTNRTQWQAFYAALGRSCPALWSGYWWTSCQSNATFAVSLSNGGFNGRDKLSSYSVFCAYDL